MSKDTPFEGTIVDQDATEVYTTDPALDENPDEPIQPTAVLHSTELARLPESVEGLLALFAQEEPTPKEVMSWILEPEQMEERDAEESARAIIARIMFSETVDDVLATSKATHAQDVLGIAFEISAVKWQRSDHQQGSSCYAVITATDLACDEKRVITCGGRNVMTQLLKLSMMKVLPVRARIVKTDKPTANGYHPLWLEPA